MLSTTIELAASTSGSAGLALTMAGTAMPTMVSMSILAVTSSLVSAAVLLTVSMSILAVVGDGAGESVDLDPVVPTVGAN
jgi:hypothetical protein